jgi:ABC-type Zn uptake system ZnuABC Zn-binding protein ZnuA
MKLLHLGGPLDGREFATPQTWCTPGEGMSVVTTTYAQYWMAREIDGSVVTRYVCAPFGMDVHEVRERLMEWLLDRWMRGTIEP